MFAQLADLHVEAEEQLIHNYLGWKPTVKEYSVVIGSVVEQSMLKFLDDALRALIYMLIAK